MGRRKQPDYSTLAVMAVCVGTCICTVWLVLHSQPDQKRSAAYKPSQGDRWEEICGYRFVDDLWSGYARTVVRLRVKRRNSECMQTQLEQTVTVAQRSFARQLTDVLNERYPDANLNAKQMPLSHREVEDVERFFKEQRNRNDAALLADLGLGPFYPDPGGTPHDHWQTQVVSHDIMHDIQAMRTAVEQAVDGFSTTKCPVQEDKREDVEREFDNMMWQLFNAGNECARMYIGFGNAEVERILQRAV